MAAPLLSRSESNFRLVAWPTILLQAGEFAIPLRAKVSTLPLPFPVPSFFYLLLFAPLSAPSVSRKENFFYKNLRDLIYSLFNDKFKKMRLSVFPFILYFPNNLRSSYYQIIKVLNTNGFLKQICDNSACCVKYVSIYGHCALN